MSSIGPPEVEMLVVIVLPMFLEQAMRKRVRWRITNRTSHWTYPEIDIELGTPSIKLSLLISSAIATLK